nr:immunoglobulin heavy chain junction region [Macaca mulatta]MOY18456.1 immunoglobulin heavy chain junction region [Macaca mulatta]MOY18679.1 immunoglobulin heavy chain junction region [Macaca mulatta]MOY18772.1 immunoglobulin heavy chain junction region [Macaca mulatta]MOY19003.1 immunoglobulin heavy chain junction region [Macaca mulatta]
CARGLREQITFDFW